MLASTLLAVAVSTGALLAALLAFNRRNSALALWPAAAGSQQSYLFWFLFRCLNMATLALAAVDWREDTDSLFLRWAAAAAALAGGIVYLWACLHLGKVNLYGGKAGLVTSAIYGWSRNPQYAIAMPTYVALAVASQSPLMIWPTGLLIAVFCLMALNEEPWLVRHYGQDYVDYARSVPRFYNVGRVFSLREKAVQK